MMTMKIKATILLIQIEYTTPKVVDLFRFVANIDEKYQAKILIRIFLSDNTDEEYLKEMLSHLNHASFGVEPWEPVHRSERGVQRILLFLQQTRLLGFLLT